MKIARKAFEQYNGIDPREIDIETVANRIDYEYVPLLWLFFCLGGLAVTVILVLLAIISI